MPKARVRVTLVAETEVEIEVNYPEGANPANLSLVDEDSVIYRAERNATNWIIDDVEVIS